MTFRHHRLPAAALGLAALLAPAARGQFAVVDVGAIAKATEQLAKAQEQLAKAEEIRSRVDAMTAAATDPYSRLASQASALGTSALTLPAALGTPPTLVSRLRARLDSTRTPLPSEPTNAELLTPPAATPAQIEAAIRPTVSGDPLAGDAAARLARERLLRPAAEQRPAAARPRGREQVAADARLAGIAVNVRTAAANAWTAHEAATDTSWTALAKQNAAQTQTLGVLQSQVLALELAQLERAAMARQDALARAGTDRVAILQAAAASKGRHRDYQADPDRDGGDSLLEDCGGRFFTCQTALPSGF